MGSLVLLVLLFLLLGVVEPEVGGLLLHPRFPTSDPRTYKPSVEQVRSV